MCVFARNLFAGTFPSREWGTNESSVQGGYSRSGQGGREGSLWEAFFFHASALGPRLPNVFKQVQPGSFTSQGLKVAG